LDNSRFSEGHHRGYVSATHPEKNTVMQRTHWVGPLNDGGDQLVEYYCPVGWRRFSLKQSLSEQFWRTSSNMYHGTAPQNAVSIIENGFRTSTLQHKCPAVYLSPSIRYTAHPRYAKIWKIDGRYFQVVLQVRVKNECVCKWNQAAEIKEKAGKGYTEVQGEQGSGFIIGTGSETMCANDEIHIDANLPDNNTMEFLYITDGNKTFVKSEDGLVVTGIMVRCLDRNPIDLSENIWWLRWVNMVLNERDPKSVKTEDALAYLRSRYTVDA